MALKDTTVNADPVARCKFGRLYDTLDKADQKTLIEWRKRGFGAPRITNGLREDGHRISQPSTSYHLAGTCPCAPGSDPLRGVPGDSPQR